MVKIRFLIFFFFISFNIISSCSSVNNVSGINIAQSEAAWVARCDPWDEWDKSGPAFHIYGSTYYVGTCGIASLLITSDEGHILIDGGPRNGGALIAENIQNLGFRLEDVKILLHSHEHHDHVGGFAELQRLSGAKLYASREATPVLESGQLASTDPQFGMHTSFNPVVVSGLIHDGDKISLGHIELTAISTPGHTPGALSWAWRACEGEECKMIAYIDSLSAISHDDYRFSDHPDYVKKFKEGLVRLSGIECDIIMTPHPSASRLLRRLNAGKGFVDKGECVDYIKKKEEALTARLKKEHQ